MSGAVDAGRSLGGAEAARGVDFTDLRGVALDGRLPGVPEDIGHQDSHGHDTHGNQLRSNNGDSNLGVGNETFGKGVNVNKPENIIFLKKKDRRESEKAGQRGLCATSITALGN